MAQQPEFLHNFKRFLVPLLYVGASGLAAAQGVPKVSNDETKALQGVVEQRERAAAERAGERAQIDAEQAKIVDKSKANIALGHHKREQGSADRGLTSLAAGINDVTGTTPDGKPKKPSASACGRLGQTTSEFNKTTETYFAAKQTFFKDFGDPTKAKDFAEEMTKLQQGAQATRDGATAAAAKCMAAGLPINAAP